jgi:hypothetical protein
MSPGGHLVTTVLACGAVYGVTGSSPLTAGLAAGGFFIDIDHVLDYVLFERRFRFSPRAFLRHYLEGRTRRLVLILHSWELMGLLTLTALMTGSVWLWGYVLGMALHLPLDVKFNGRLTNQSLVPFYSFVYRWRRGFLRERLIEQKPLARLHEGFWMIFFRGARLRNPQVHAVHQPKLAERVLRSPAPPTLAPAAVRSPASSHPRPRRLEARPKSS